MGSHGVQLSVSGFFHLHNALEIHPCCCVYREVASSHYRVAFHCVGGVGLVESLVQGPWVQGQL